MFLCTLILALQPLVPLVSYASFDAPDFTSTPPVFMATWVQTSLALRRRRSMSFGSGVPLLTQLDLQDLILILHHHSI